MWVFTIKQMTNQIRETMRNELSNLYDDLVDGEKQIIEDNKEEDKKVDDNKSENNSGSRIASGDKSNENEGVNSSPSQSYMEAIKRNPDYIKSHRRKSQTKKSRQKKKNKDGDKNN